MRLFSRHRTLTCTAPPSLQRGDRIALVSPSYLAPMDNITRTAEILREWGFEPVIGPNVGKLDAGQYAGTLEERVSDLRWALQDPGIKAILCNRGGYGTIQLLERLRPRDFAASPKWLIGFSDITTLLEMQNSAGLMAIHGPMCKQIARSGGEDEGSRALHGLLLGKHPHYELPPHPLNRPGTATGVLVGGNLCTFAANLDSWADTTRFDHLVLFIEEVEESMHHIDRLFQMLRLRGVLERCEAVILGEFTGCGAEFDYGSVEAMLLNYLKDYNIPVLCGFPAGHGDDNRPLVMGAPVRVVVRPDGAILHFNTPAGASKGRSRRPAADRKESRKADNGDPSSR